MGQAIQLKALRWEINPNAIIVLGDPQVSDLDGRNSKKGLGRMEWWDSKWFELSLGQLINDVKTIQRHGEHKTWV